MKSLRKFLLLSSIFILNIKYISSQIVITPNVGATGVINSVGSSGIVVSNVTINCGNNSYGTFANGVSSGLGLGTGLLLSTGKVSEINATGLNQNDDFDFDVGTTSTDPLLAGLIGVGIDMYDPCIIEFDVVPQCGTINLTFLFGSDEYTNWISQGFNDGFGFFVTGPNPLGGMYTNQNFATLPSGTIVSIDNVNPTTNPTFFVNNNTGTANNHLDGFTTVLNPIISVVPCQTYHFKLAIADAGDAQVDSAVLIDIIQCNNPLTIATTSTSDHCNESIGTATVTTAGGFGPFTYSWSPSGGTNATATGLLAGTYTVTVNDILACTPSITSTVVVASTGVIPTVTVPASFSVCNGQAVAANSFTSTPSGATYTWTNSNISIGLGANGTVGTPAFSAINSGNTSITATITITPTITGQCPGTPSLYTITVIPTPLMSPLSNISVCSGVMIPTNVLTSNVLGTSFNWANSNTSIGLAATGIGNISSFTGNNFGISPMIATIGILPSVGLCLGAPVTYTIEILPIPTMVAPPSISVCPNELISPANFVSTPAGSTFTWTNSNTSINLVTNGSSNILPFNGQNITNSAQISTITVQPSLAGCIGQSVNFTLTVKPKPIANNPPDIDECANIVIIPSSFVSSSVGATFNWFNDNSLIGLGTVGIGNIGNFTAQNSGTTPIIGIVKVIPLLNSCIGDTVDFSITVNPIPLVTATNNGPICEGENLELYVNTTTGGSYLWSGPSGFTSTIQNPILNFALPNESGDYSVTVTSSNNCTNFGITTVLINPLLIASINPAGPFCENNNPITLTATNPVGLWSGAGITNVSTGQFDPSIAVVGSNIITFTTVGNCSTTTTETIIINEVPNVEFTSNINSGCAPLSVTFTNTTNPMSDLVQWNFGDLTTSTEINSITHVFSTVGCYDISLVSTTGGCSSSLTQSQMICVYPNAIASFTVLDTAQSVDNPLVHFFNESQNATSYIWNFGDGNEAINVDAFHLYDGIPSNYTIMLIAQNEYNCPDTAYQLIRIKDILLFYIPNAFTPDKDDYNEIFLPIFTSGFDPNHYTLIIYNRWGQNIFQTNNSKEGWNGTFKGERVQDDVYTWKIEFIESETKKIKVVVGHVSLLR